MENTNEVHKNFSENIIKILIVIEKYNVYVVQGQKLERVTLFTTVK